MEPRDEAASTHPLRLLSLDGGGIRGISELVILEEIMHRVGRSENVSNPLPADYFDLICGTSTGGLIALLLGRLRYSVPEAIDKYGLLAKKVFSEKKPRGKDGTFKASNLEKAIQEAIEWKLGTGRGQEAMFVNDPSACKTFVCAVPAKHINKQPRLFRTWSADKNPGYNCAIWEAARATSAAPQFFKRIYIGDQGLQEEFIDAGIGCNNPTRYLVEETKKEFGPERMVSCIVSIGAGRPKVTGVEAPSLFQRLLPLTLIKVLAKLATDTEAEARDMENRFQNCPGVYHRLNVNSGLEEISLEEWEKLGDVKQHTMTYLGDAAVSKEIDTIVNALTRKTSTTLPLGQLDGAIAAVVHSHHFIYPSYQVPHYITRKEPLRSIIQLFQKPPRKGWPNVVVLLGMGGCGKSQHALEYCRQGENERWFSAIFWLDASSRDSMAQSFAKIANTLSKPNLDIADQAGNSRFVRETMETWKTRWLLVFDNFDDPDSFKHTNIGHFFPRSELGSILITSRHAASKNLGAHVEITCMESGEALQLLLRRSQIHSTDSNEEEGARIVNRLGYHALAIDQAGAYILARNLSLDLYLTRYLNRKEKGLKEIPQSWDYRRKIKSESEFETELTVFTTWELSIDLIRGDIAVRNDKIHLLTLSGFFDGQEVSDDLFTCYGTENGGWFLSCTKDDVWDRYEMEDMLQELRSLSLLQSLHITKNETTFSLHPLIQDWVKLRIDSNAHQRYLQEAILVLSASVQHQPIYQMSFKTKQSLLNHLEAIRNESGFTTLMDDTKEIDLMYAAYNFYKFFESQGLYNIATEMNNIDLKKSIELLGAEHPDTLTSMNNLASLLDSQGKYNEAEPMYRQTLQLQEKVLGTEHPDTLTSMSNLASLLKSQGQYDEAEPMYRRALELREKVLSTEHPATLISMNNLANLLYRQGKYDEAEPIYRQTLQLQEKVLGTEHPDTLKSIYNLANCLRQQGKHSDAKFMFLVELSRCEVVYGMYHAETV